MNHLHEAILRLGSPRILVVGDLMLDRYTWGSAERISPEAPVMVLRAEHEEVRLGGAASVAALLRSLDAEVTLLGVIGDDGTGRVLRKLIQDDGIDDAAILTDAGRPTTSKERFMGQAAHRQPQQILRVDREQRTLLPAGCEQTLLAALTDRLSSHAAVLVSDYSKGVCTPELLRQVIDRAAAEGVPVFIDPARIDDYARYRCASLLVPNRVEAELATGRKIHNLDDSLAVAKFLAETWGIPAVLLKIDHDGMVLNLAGQPSRHFPVTLRAVYDVTGAGDMVLAMVGLCRTSGLDWEETVQIANLAAGLEIEKLGVVPVTRAELRAAVVPSYDGVAHKLVSLQEMVVLAETYRHQDKTLVFTNGCFDLLHVGHTTYLQEAAQMGDILIAALNSDASVRRLKGSERPVIGQADRASMLAALGCVDHVLIFEEDTPCELLRRLRPDVLVKGGTYSIAEIVGKEIVEDYGGQVRVTGKIKGVSTTDILSSLRKQSQETVSP